MQSSLASPNEHLPNTYRNYFSWLQAGFLGGKNKDLKKEITTLVFWPCDWKSNILYTMKV